MPKVKLTVRFIDGTRPSQKDQIFSDTELTGFGLKVTPTGKRTFFVYYRNVDGVQRRPRVGDYPQLKLEQARRLAQNMLAQVRAGGDPSAERMANRATQGHGTVAELFEQYASSKKRAKKRTVAEMRRIFAHDILPVLGSRRAEKVTSQEVTRLLDSIEARSSSVALAVRRQLSAFYSWVMPRLPTGSTNPMTYASKPAPLRARDRVLTEAELRSLWLALEKEPPHWRRALRMLILTGQRREEVLAASWDEIDLSGRTWTIPADRAKNDQPHIVPLSSSVIQILSEMPARQGRLFPAGTGAISKAAKRVRDAMPNVPHWRWHDIRRTVATGMQRIGVRLEVTEAVLNHISGSRSGIVGVYQRYDWAKEKREALELWADEASRIVK